MINGLQSKIPGKDLIELMQKQINFHHDRAAIYENQLNVLAEAGIEMSNMTGDPKAQALAKGDEHKKSAGELSFMLKYIDPQETYILSQYDLIKIGVIGSR